MPKVGGVRKVVGPTPMWQTRCGQLARLYQGHAKEVLAGLPRQSVHMVVTSPPYWGQRDYGTGEWIGGDKECDHLRGSSGIRGNGASTDNRDRRASTLQTTTFGNIAAAEIASRRYKDVCGKCGATRIDQQIGSERTPQEFVDSLCDVFDTCLPVLRDDGTFWLNIGDTYEDGELVGVPWLVAFELKRRGWQLRAECIWDKPSCMPESVKSRPNKAHEQIFMFCKRGQSYYFDMDAVKVPTTPAVRIVGGKTSARAVAAGRNGPSGNENPGSIMATGDKGHIRSVWRFSHGGGYTGNHFAVFPPKLPEICIKAGTSEYGCCANCGAPWRRVVQKERKPTRPGTSTKVKGNGAHEGNRDPLRHVTEVRTVGWEPGCKCSRDEDTPIPFPVKPCVVLDPFVGSGTTVAVALGLGRAGWGIDLSEQYLEENAIPRVEGELMERPALRSLLPTSFVRRK